MFILNDFFHWFSRRWVKASIVAALGVWSAILAWPTNSVQIIFCNAGQGDETLIQHGFYQILLDSSRPGRALDCLSRHAPFFDRTIEMMVITHPQLDHFGGAEQVLERYTVMRYVYNGFGSDSPEWMRLSEKLREKNVPISVVSAGDEIRMGNVVFRVLWPNVEDGKDNFSQVARQTFEQTSGVEAPSLSERPFEKLMYRLQSFLTGVQFLRKISLPPSSNSTVLGIKSFRNPNVDGIVLAMSYGKFRALFTSDIGEEEEKEIIKRLQVKRLERLEKSDSDNLIAFSREAGSGSAGQPVNLSSFNLLKVAHHGSKTSSSTIFLEAVRPALAVIEVGKNSYGHPTKEAINRLKAVGARVFRTDQDGDVVVETDGKQWKISTNKQK